MNLSSDELERACQLANELCGIQWDASKQYLVESRLKSVAEANDCSSFDSLLKRVPDDRAIRNQFIDAVTTRETLFFRDEAPFRALEHKVLPEVIDAKTSSPFSRRLRIWSAACSSGQEPYSLAITLMNLIPDIHNWDVQILATDISDAAIEQASKGIYSEFEVGRGLPPAMRDRYFVPDNGRWRVRDEVRSLIQFQKRNLLESFAALDRFDVIFCRNVAIYFDLPVKRDLFERLAAQLESHGAIFVGSSELLMSFGQRWMPKQHCRTIFYQPHLSLTNSPPTWKRQSALSANS